MALPAESSSLSPKAQAVLQASRARTGFDSYRAYLDFHRKENPELEDLAAILGTPTEPNAEPPYTHRGPKQKSSLVLNVSTSWHLSVDHVHSDVDGTNIIEAICDPPKDAHLQIIVWNISPFTTMKFHGDLIDFLGLRFSLDPRVFLALYSAISLDNNNDENKRHENGLDRYVPTHVNMGNFIATVCHSRHQSDDIPVILIAGLRPSEFVHGQFDPCPPFSHSLTPGMQLEAIPTLGAYSLYPRSLIHLLERYSDAQADYDDLLLLCFLPLFQQSLVEIRYWCGAMRDTFSKGRRTDSTMDKRLEEDLYDQRAELRRDISKIEDRWSNFVRYMRLRLGWNPSSKPFYQDFEDDIKHFAGEANRLENEIREYLQLRAGILGVEAGRLGLEGSAKSFELSNLQMEEGKRGKSHIVRYGTTVLTLMLQLKPVRLLLLLSYV